MQNVLENIKHNFEKNVGSVYSLMNFDQVLLGFTIKSISDLVENLKNSHSISNPSLTGEKTLNILETIQKNESLRPQYSQIYNQCVVLLVSYFGSSVGDIFKSCLTMRFNDGIDAQFLKEEIKLSLGELYDLSFNLSDNIGEIIANKKDISFQDMQSISRAFRDYFGFETEKDKKVNNIITGQACRHVIVHSGNIADSKLQNQVKNANPRDIKQNIKAGEEIQFSPEEIQIVGDSMKKYIETVTESLLKTKEV